ncbi:MAG: hypothetical protein HGB12_05625, partial [Bacteroidetes bacterium]|nr:hypothetical protein [Bacteroidota bacterium]
MNKTKIYKIYGFIIKIAIIVIALCFIYWRLIVKYSLHTTLMSFKESFLQPSFTGTFLLVIILMIVNWSIETLKWKYLIRKIEIVPFHRAFFAVLTGVTISIFTPNRIGEYGGRVFVLRKAKRWEGVFITVLGSMSQLLVTLFVGSISFVFFAHEYITLPFYPEYSFYGLVLIAFTFTVILLLLFFNISFLTGLMSKFKGRLRRISLYGRVFSFYTFKELLITLLFSSSRYLIFIIQFYLLLNLFNAKIPFGQSFIMVSVIYFVMATIPTITLTEIGVRGSV